MDRYNQILQMAQGLGQANPQGNPYQGGLLGGQNPMHQQQAGGLFDLTPQPAMQFGASPQGGGLQDYFASLQQQGPQTDPMAEANALLAQRQQDIQAALAQAPEPELAASVIDPNALTPQQEFERKQAIAANNYFNDNNMAP